MKYPILIVFVFLIFGTPGFADEGVSPFADKEAMYAHFDDPALFKSLLFKAKDIASWLSDECKKGDKTCRIALDLMNQPFSRWNHLDAKSGFHTVANCREQMAVSHPNPGLHKILGKPITHSLRDINGKLWILALCDGIQTRPNGLWISQFSSWCRSITGLNEIWIISFFTEVPGTPFQILSHLPFNPKSFKDLKEKVKELNGNVDQWSEEWARSKQ